MLMLDLHAAEIYLQTQLKSPDLVSGGILACQQSPDQVPERPSKDR